MHHPRLASSILLLLLVAAAAGCAAPEPPGPTTTVPPPTEAGVRAVALRLLFDVSPGHAVTVPVLFGANESLGPASVRLAGATLASAWTNVTGQATVLFLGVNVTEAFAGNETLAFELARNGTLAHVQRDAVRLRSIAAGPVFGPASSGTVIYTGRLAATGEVFNTNDPDLRDAPFPRIREYAYTPSILPVRGGDEPTVVKGLYEALLGMRPGESRTVEFGPDHGWGAETLREREPRDEILPREHVVRIEEERSARETFESHIASQGGNASEYAVGDVFTLEQAGNVWRYRITEMDATSVAFVVTMDVGDVFTLYPFWPEASVVVAAGEDGYVLRTTPTTQVGEPLTVRAPWPAMSTLVSVNDTDMAIRHSPPEGLVYSSLDVGGVRRELRVEEVTETTIVVSYENPSPLAGRDVVFDVELVSLTVA